MLILKINFHYKALFLVNDKVSSTVQFLIYDFPFQCCIGCSHIGENKYCQIKYEKLNLKHQ